MRESLIGIPNLQRVLDGYPVQHQVLAEVERVESVEVTANGNEVKYKQESKITYRLTR